MRFHWLPALALLVCAVACRAETTLPIAVRGAVTVQLLPDAGPLTLTISKKDLNIYEGPDVLRAVLLDPSRRTVGTLTLDDDGGSGEVATGKINVECQQMGVYRLAFNVPSDLIYGLTTNCDKLICQGGIVLNDPALATRVYFQPPAGEFSAAVAALHPGGKQVVTLHDANDVKLAELDLLHQTEKTPELFGPRTSGGYVAGGRIELPERTGNRDGLWWFDLQKLDCRLDLKGVGYWTVSREAWFDAAASRWLLTPYNATRYLQPGEQAEVTFQLRNTSSEDASYEIAAQMADGASAKIVEPDSPVTVPQGSKREVRIVLSLPPNAVRNQRFEGLISARRAGDPAVSGSAWLAIETHPSRVPEPLQLPIKLRRYEHENAQFGYAPEYLANEVYFDPQNRPFIRERSAEKYPTRGISFLAGGKWVYRDFDAALKQRYPDYKYAYMGAGFLGCKVAFDHQGGAYTLLSGIFADSPRRVILLFTPDDGQTWQTFELPNGAFDVEAFNGHNPQSGPPPILLYEMTAKHPATWATVHRLSLYLPKREGDQLVLGEPTVVSENCIGSCQHSGAPNSTATRDGKVQIVWGECTKPGETLPGVPTYLATYDQATGQLGQKVLLGYGPPLDDVHNAPGICLDSQGYLHVITGAHGEAFTYRRSLKPNDAYGGWTESEPVLTKGFIDPKTGAERGRQTYLSLCCDQNDTLHIAFRQWRCGVEDYLGGQNYAALSIQSKPSDGPWSDAQPIVVPPMAGYSIYYHKLTVDHRGRLFLSYSYLTADQTYQDDFPDLYHDRAIVTSTDGGRTWKLAETKDFLP